MEYESDKNRNALNAAWLKVWYKSWLLFGVAASNSEGSKIHVATQWRHIHKSRDERLWYLGLCRFLRYATEGQKASPLSQNHRSGSLWHRLLLKAAQSPPNEIFCLELQRFT
jgi:hypothetical protein